MITTPAGQALAKQSVELLEAMKELDKHAPHEVGELLAAWVSHVRSWKPQALLATQVEEAGRG